LTAFALRRLSLDMVTSVGQGLRERPGRLSP
jgi:hypothetical protein